MSDTTLNLVDHGFMDARIKLIDVAAFLDRIQRHGQSEDYRVIALTRALQELNLNEPIRARRILETLSDPTDDPVSISTGQGACGAYAPERQ